MQLRLEPLIHLLDREKSRPFKLCTFSFLMKFVINAELLTGHFAGSSMISSNGLAELINILSSDYLKNFWKSVPFSLTKRFSEFSFEQRSFSS